MVRRNGSSKPQPTKKPSRSLQDEHVETQETTQPKNSGSLPPFVPPSAHYAMMYVDDSGSLKVAVSLSAQEISASIFTPKVKHTFMQAIGREDKPQQHIQDKPSSTHLKRRRRTSSCGGRSQSPQNMLSLRVSDSENIFSFYEDAFREFGQRNCCTLVRAWIKFLEPDKRGKYPYKEDKKTGEMRKPPWWPDDVIHKRTDYTDTKTRVKLLIHILCNLGKITSISKKLREIADRIKPRFLKPPKIKVLDKIFRVRMMQERWERGEIDSGTVIYISNDMSSRIDSLDEPVVNPEGEEDIKEPTPSAIQAMPSPACSLSMGNEQNQAYSFRSFCLQGQLRQDTLFGSTLRDNGSSAGSFPHIPGSSAIPRPHVQPACEYFPQTPFPAPSAEEQMRHYYPSTTPILSRPGQANAWMPASRHSTLNLADYGSSQAIEHIPTQYPFPMIPGTLLPGIPHIDS